ncbi:MAG: MFS transporter, partial [Jatrophihabitantaceae bacterium]
GRSRSRLVSGRADNVAPAMSDVSQSRPRAGFTGVLRQREFGLLWLADVQSLLGDQLARVALAVLVYDRTGSGFATAAVYALTFLPALIGSVLLGPIADRIPRRALLVTGDLVRAGLLAVMALPGMPIPVLALLLVVAVLVGTPWKAAERALIVDMLTAEDYVTGTGLRTATTQASQLLGFAIGGVAVATIGSRAALAIDAGTFLVSAIVIRAGVRTRPAAHVRDGAAAPTRWLDGSKAVLRDRRLRLLLALSWLLGILVVPEALAAPYAAQLGAGSRTVGLLLAAMPAGVLVGSLVYARLLSHATRAGLLGPLAVIAGLPLLACALDPGVVVTLVLWSLTGLCTAYQVQVAVEFVRTIAPEIRGQGLSLAAGGLLGVQGLGMLAGGALVLAFAPSTTVAIAGATATVLGAWFALLHRRAQRPGGLPAGPLAARSA